jgi:hypothetical protein
MSKDKAIVKETGELHKVESQYVVKHMTMTFNFDMNEEQSEHFEEMLFVHDSEPQEEGEYYTLDDGKVYHEKDVIVGTEEIRDSKLNQIL